LGWRVCRQVAVADSPAPETGNYIGEESPGREARGSRLFPKGNRFSIIMKRQMHDLHSQERRKGEVSLTVRRQTNLMGDERGAAGEMPYRKKPNDLNVKSPGMVSSPAKGTGFSLARKETGERIHFRVPQEER